MTQEDKYVIEKLYIMDVKTLLITEVIVNEVDKPVNICSDIEHNTMFTAFDCIRKHIEREKKYGNNTAKLYKKG